MPATSCAYKLLLAAGLRTSVLLVTLVYLDKYERNGSNTRKRWRSPCGFPE